jgi:hypothetical protein
VRLSFLPKDNFNLLKKADFCQRILKKHPIENVILDNKTLDFLYKNILIFSDL